MIIPPSFIIEWSSLMDQIILAGERVYYMFWGLGYWFTAPISEAFGDPLSPFYLKVFGIIVNAITALEFAINLATNGLYGDLITALVGVDTITGISMLSIIGCNILFLLFLRFLFWLWDIISKFFFLG